jgi:hypothetical protein
MHGVDADEVRTQEAQPRQPFQRAYAVLLEAVLDFVGGFVDVGVNRQAELFGQGVDAVEGSVCNGIGRMRGESKAEQRLIFQCASRRARPLAR